MKKNLKNAIEIVCFLLVVSLGMQALNYAFVDDEERLTRLTLHDLYEQENIDTLFLGSSHCYFSLNPEVVDSLLGVHSFNLGTSKQQYDGSYTLLLETDRLYDLDTVYLELYYDVADGQNREERTDLTDTYIISDYIKNPINRVHYLLQASKKDYWINGLFPARRYWKNAFDTKEVTNIIKNKQTSSYRNYESIELVVGMYSNKGYVASDNNNNPFFFDRHKKPISNNPISNDNLSDLKRISEYCKKKNIKLVLFSTPMTDFCLADVGNYDDYVNAVKLVAQEMEGVEYYDFNLCKPEYFPCEEELFMDGHHLNAKGAQKFSTLFSEFFGGKISEEDLFYNSYEEKTQAAGYRILGHYIISNEEKRTFEIGDNGIRKEEFRITLVELDDANTEISRVVLQDYCENKVVEIPRDIKGKIIVEHREKGKIESECLEYDLEKEIIEEQ